MHATTRTHARPGLLPALALGIGLALSSTCCVAAGPQASTPQVRAELVASVSAVQPGEQIRLGVQQKIIPHWHTYWVNPGDSGLATTIAWTLPEGATAGDIQWPSPGRFAMGPITNYGYENEVTLLSALNIPANVRPGALFPVKATVNWLVCQETCIPQQVELELKLPVVAAGSPRQPGSPLIAQAAARLPVASPWQAELTRTASGLELGLSGAGLGALKAADVWFYPDQWGRIAHGAAQPVKIEGDRLSLGLTPGDDPLPAGHALGGVLVVSGQNSVKGYVIQASSGAAAPANAGTAPAAPADEPTLGAALLFALLGGLILNLMPCVFPVLSIKALSLLKHVHQSPARTRLQGLAYTAGVLASFLALAGVLIALKAGGSEVGWGFQFQSPLFVLGVAYLMFVVGLSLSGAFTLGASAAGVGASLADKPGYTGSFFTGVLATVVATPCTAPFMGAALGFALGQPAPVLVAVFLSLGLGLALPYLLLSFWPALQRLLPRPGPWMERLKQALAFPMYGAAVWLVWVLAQQAGPNAIAIALGGMLAIAFAAWLYETSHGTAPLARHGSRGLAAAALSLALAGGYFGVASSAADATPASTAGKAWEPYSKARFEALRADGKPVFVNFTAAWCITCLANERVALSDAAVLAAFRDAGITYLKGDWTNQDAQISAHLADFGRSGVPLYLFYPGGTQTEARVLPQLLTPATVIDALAAPSPSLALAPSNLAKE